LGVDVVAFALLMGTAATLRAQELGTHAGDSWMLSVRNVPREAVEGAIAQVKDTELALRNGHTHFVIAGAPAALRQVESLIEQAAEKHNAELDDKRSGGTRVEPLFNELKVSAPFHFTAMQPGADRAAEWASALGLTVSAQALAEDILVKHHDWPAELSALTTSTEITHAAEVAPSTFYRLFQTKEGLFTALPTEDHLDLGTVRRSHLAEDILTLIAGNEWRGLKWVIEEPDVRCAVLATLDQLSSQLVSTLVEQGNDPLRTSVEVRSLVFGVYFTSLEQWYAAGRRESFETYFTQALESERS